MCADEQFPSWWDDEASILMLDFGYDEGGEGSKLLVSVQLGTTRRLRRFSRRWKTLLRDSDVKFWHSIDYDNFSKGVFADLDGKARQKLLGRLARLIHDHMDVGITAVLDTALFERETDPRFRNEWGTAFCFAVENVAIYAYEWLLDAGRQMEPVNVLIEGGHKNAGQALEHLRKLIGNDKAFLRMKTCGLGGKADNPILQAADMLAYSEWKYLTQSGREIFDALHIRGFIRGGSQGIWSAETSTLADRH